MSDVLRLIAGGLLALLSSYVGLLIRRRYVVREKFYQGLCELCTHLTTELSFKKTPLPLAVSSFTSGRKGELSSLMDGFVAELKAKGNFRRKPDDWEISGLKPKEKTELLDFLDGLGKTALDGQLAHLSRWQSAFDAHRAKCADETKRLGGMYFKLMVLFGLAALVVVA